MEIIPELQPMAYVLIGIIALKLLLALPPLHYEMPNVAFAIVVFGVLGITVIFHFWKIKRHGHKHM